MASVRELRLFLILSLAICLNIIEVKGGEKLACAVLNPDGKTLHVKLGCDSSQPAVAWGKFRDEINSTGWSFLEVHSNGSYPDITQAMAMGMTEGFLTGELIYKAYQNTLAGYCDSEPEFCVKLGRFLGENEKWMSAQIASNYGDKFWHQVNLILAQLEGLKKGYAANASLPSILDFGFLLMQANGDLGDLEQALGKKNIQHVIGSGSCSALIKLLPGNKDLYISHVTWDSYSAMLRVFKLYDIPVSVRGDKRDIIPGRKQSFSSYPGILTSSDDFYMLSSGMLHQIWWAHHNSLHQFLWAQNSPFPKQVMKGQATPIAYVFGRIHSQVSQETTIDNSNPNLWKYVSATGIVLEWMRSIVANRLARTTVEWAYLFSNHNSGTYNNQWMVLDYKQFTPGEDIKPGTLVILEQMPGIIEVADMSVFLQENTYWASYNLPYFPYIYNMSGTMASYKKFGAFFSYEGCPRAQIFKRDHSKVVDMETMMKLMRYNDFQHDPLSRCNCTPPYSGENGISARSDLNPADGKYPIYALGHRRHGGIDAKITNSEMVKTLQCMAVSGPTHDQQPVFKWSTSGWKRPVGHPDAWDFEPVMVTWE